MTVLLRKTTQALLPLRKPVTEPGVYDIYPTFPVPVGNMFSGFTTLAERLSGFKTIIIDGFEGIGYEEFVAALEAEFSIRGLRSAVRFTAEALKPSDEVEGMISPFLGGDDPLFGTRTTLSLEDFFDTPKLSAILPDPAADINILAGPGAALAGWDGLLVYIDLPKNELQYRARAGSVMNLGASQPASPKAMYKRFYFVDWIVLNRHKGKLAKRVDLVVDGQRPDEPVWMEGSPFWETLNELSRNTFRVRPWFEPGAWGGHWIRTRIPGVNPDVPNYAWSFEMIVPENGLILENKGLMLEVTFDWLMFLEPESVLGNAYPVYGSGFPIRFDFLDTFDGGNLSIQCHPKTNYIREHFGETFTQQEAYYILDTQNNAKVNLGFCEDIDPEAFRKELEASAENGTSVDIERFVQAHPARKHDLFLIPDGTIHGSGTDNLVLEISTTPYIYTFKLYDWLRPDLDGNPRDLNIRRAFDNLCFERKGDLVKKELISHPALLSEAENGQVVHLPTHPLHLYDVIRFHFTGRMSHSTGNDCLVMSLVEGTSILVRTGIREQRFNYAETFVIPAAAGTFEMIHEGPGEAMVVAAFMKPVNPR